MEILIDQLRRHEGLRLDPYKDSLGYSTIGYGHKITGPHLIDKEIAEAIFRHDVAQAVNDSYRIPRDLRSHLNQTRMRVITNMIYNMGLRGTMLFKRMWAAIERDDFKTAADEMLDSRWARKQVGNRAIELSEIMRRGV